MSKSADRLNVKVKIAKVFRVHTGKHFHDFEADMCFPKALTMKRNGEVEKVKWRGSALCKARARECLSGGKMVWSSHI